MKYETDNKEKEVTGTSRNLKTRNHNEYLAGDSQAISALHYAEIAEKIQCEICFPAAYKPGKTTKLCPTCKTKQENRKDGLLNLLTTPAKIIKLTARCFSCNRGLTPARMASGAIICRTCAKDLRTKGATAQNNFVERVKANVGKFLKEVVAI